MEDKLGDFLAIWKPYHKELFWFVDYDLDRSLDRDLGTNEEPEVKTPMDKRCWIQNTI